jgi:hypothetical protein
MSKQTTGWILVIVGLVLALLAVTADYIGLGVEGSGMGYKQIVLLVIGLLVVIVGLVLSRGKR